MHRKILPLLFVSLWALCASLPAAAAGKPVDLELALAVDVSNSIDPEEARMQRNGYVAAFRHADVISAIERGMLGRIAVTYYEWAGDGHVRVLADWTIIEDAASANRFANRLEAAPLAMAPRTSIAGAIDHAVRRFPTNGFEGTRLVIDISGDGPNNGNAEVTLARDQAVASGISINGLPIVNGRADPDGGLPLPDLADYYRDCVIGGPGAFIVVAHSFDEFALAIRRKLITEIAGLTLPPRGQEAGPRFIPAAALSRTCDFGLVSWSDIRVN